MSEVIVRMEMPKCCNVCPCLDDYGDYPRCRISGEQRGYNFPICEMRMPNCPIIGELPEHHGDLIDRDEMFYAIRSRVALIDSVDGTLSGREQFERDILCTCLHDVVCEKAVIAAERKDYETD